MPARTPFWTQHHHQYSCSSFCHWGAKSWGCWHCPAIYLWNASGGLPRCQAHTPELHTVPLCLSEPSFLLPPTPCWGWKHICCGGNKSDFTTVSSHSQNETIDKLFSCKFRKYLAWILNVTSSLHRGAAFHQGRRSPQRCSHPWQ